jgi:hypothetical protein
MSSIDTGWHWPGIALSEGHDVTAAASEAHDAKIDERKFFVRQDVAGRPTRDEGLR